MAQQMDTRLSQGCHTIHTRRQPIQIKRLADLVHLSKTKVKRAKKRTFSPHLFPEMTTKKDRECKCVLAADLKNRGSVILKHVSEKFNADTDQMKCEMPSVINAVLQCYGGDCSDCAEKSAGTCTGGDDDNWFVRSRSLRENGITALHPSETDIQAM